MSDLSKQVQVALEEMVGAGTENGVQAAVYHRGALVADVVAGTADPGTGAPVAPDTVFYAASAAKGVAATVVHVLAERGVLDYDTRIAELWPEFAAHGKDSATVRHALTHSVGVPVLPKDLPTSTRLLGTARTPSQVLMVIGNSDIRNTTATFTAKPSPSQRISSGTSATSGIA